MPSELITKLRDLGLNPVKVDPGPPDEGSAEHLHKGLLPLEHRRAACSAPCNTILQCADGTTVIVF